ncbi:9175_t:CDS:2 [Dentiscutata heterogama]|uniref:9175_t:CDS:1 n=1 Tax=Dentiscutata heterogama TaxID=1316150 RepID=A0ACA9LG65_9GLOM|nr:9175_t:CDS:2 [Dentiscutata heterogama]
MTSHKPPEEAFNFRRHNINEEMSTQCDWSQFYCRLDYVIEFKSIWHDEMDLRTTKLIFHKGSEEEFRNMTWDVKYRKGEFTSEELKAVVQELTKNQDAKRTPNKRLKRQIEKFINDSDYNNVNISNSRMMLDNNYFVQKPVEVIEMTNEYASSQGRLFLTRQEIIENQNEESHHLNKENANI